MVIMLSQMNDWATIAPCFSAITGFITLVLTFASIFVAFREYRSYKRDKQSEVLFNYNERYENSPSIRLVVRYCTDVCSENPSVYDKEMFLRFFEELEMMIQAKYLKEKDVLDYFSFYFLLLWTREDSFFWEDGMLNENQNVDGFKNSPEWKHARLLYDRLIVKLTDKDKNNFEHYLFRNK